MGSEANKSFAMHRRTGGTKSIFESGEGLWVEGRSMLREGKKGGGGGHISCSKVHSEALLGEDAVFLSEGATSLP